MKYIIILAFFASARTERVHVVTPQSRLPENSEPATENDSYVKAYQEVHNIVRERRNPLGSYTEDYNTLSHSSFIEDDVYPELNYKTSEHHKPHHHHHHHHHQQQQQQYHKQHHSHPFIYGAPSPISHHHHHHHPEHVSSHHTLIDFPSPMHLITAFLHKFGLNKIAKIIAKIAVLKVILKFVTIIALFLVLPAIVPAQDKEKEDSDDDGLFKSLNDVTNKVWNGITVREKIEVHQQTQPMQHQVQQSNQQMNQQTHPKPPQPVTNPPVHDASDKDKDKDKCKEKDNNTKCMEKDKCRDKDREKDMCKDKCKNKDDEKDKHESALDEVNLKLLNKIIKQWKEENFGGPDKSSAISFLHNCVTTANRILGFLLGYLKMKNGNMDVLDGMMVNRFSIYMKNFVKTWSHIMSGWKI